MITVGLCRGKNVLVPRYPAPPKPNPPLLFHVSPKCGPLPSLLVIEQNERSAPVMIARDYLSLPSPPKQLQRIKISDAPWSFLSPSPENQPRNAISQAGIRSITDVNSNQEVQMFFFLLKAYFCPVLLLLLALNECQESAFVPCTSLHIINTLSPTKIL